MLCNSFLEGPRTGLVVSISQQLTKYAVEVPSRKDNEVLDIIERHLKQLVPNKQPELVFHHSNHTIFENQVFFSSVLLTLAMHLNRFDKRQGWLQL